MKKHLTLFVFFSLVLSTSFSQVTLAPASDLLVPRCFHESQVLSTGKVLVFGGNNGNALSLIKYKSCELYDPASNSWSSTGNMSQARELFASVVLNNGKVLAIGGNDTTCEIYDPFSGVWTAAASMHALNKKAIRLNDGRVLAVASTTTEIYDPYTNKWLYADTTVIPHGTDCSLALLDNGKVLLTGGSNAKNKAELFDPITNSWTLIPNSLSQERRDHLSVKLSDGRIFISSGDAGYCEIYDPTTNQFTLTGNMQLNLGANPIILMDNGNVLAYGLGDIFNPGDTKCIQVYNTSTGVWSAGGTYNFVGRHFYTFSKLKNGKILVAGGTATTGNGASTTCYLVTPTEFSSCTEPNVNLTLNSTPACYGKSPSVTINGTEAGVTYTAFIAEVKAGNATAGGGTLSLNLNAAVLQPGTNIVSIHAKKAGCPTFIINNTATINSSLSITSKPPLNYTGEVVVCSGDSIQLTTASGYASYYWSNGKITTSPGIFVKPSTSIQVKYADGAGCTSVASDFVKVFTPTIAKGGPEVNTCDNAAPFLLTDYSPKGGTWTGTGVSSNGTYTPANVGAGTYVLTYTVCGLSTTKTVIVNPTTLPLLTAHFIKDTICYYEAGTLEITDSKSWIYYTLRNGTTAIGGAQQGNSGTLSFPTSNISTTTTLNVLCSTWNPCGAFTKEFYYRIIVKPNPALVVTVTDPLICKGGKTFVIIDSSEKNVSYQLKIGTMDIYNPILGNGGSAKIEVGPLTTAQTYTVSATYKTCYPRELTNKATVGIQQPVSYYAPSNFNVQPGEYISFTNNSNNPLGTYNWHFGTGANMTTSTLSDPDSIFYTPIGSYPVSLISTSPLGCKDTLTRTINVFTYKANDSCVAARGRFDGHQQSFPVALANDKDDNTYLYGKVDGSGGEIKAFSKYTDTLRVGSKTSYLTGNILAKYKKNGTPDWMVTIEHTSPWARVGNIDVDDAGDVYLAYFQGESQDKIRFYSVDKRYYSFAPPSGANNQSSVIVCKYNSKGYFQWVRTFLDPYWTWKSFVRVDPKGFVYVGSEINLCKYKLNGDTVWQIHNQPMQTHGIEIDDKNNVHILKANSIQIYKYDTDGNFLSATDPATNTVGFNTGSSHLKLDDKGNGYAAGIFTGKLTFAGNTYESTTGSNQENGYLASYDVTTGKQNWFVHLKLGRADGTIRTMGLDFKNGVGILTGNVYSSNETLTIGNQTFSFPQSGYFSLNFNASGAIYNFKILASPSPYSYIYIRNLVTFNKTNNNTTIGFEFKNLIQYGGTTYYSAGEPGVEFIMLKGNPSCLSPIVTSVSNDLHIPDNSHGIKIFPNPAGSNEQVYISVSSELKEETTVFVTDITGKQIGNLFGSSLNTGMNQIQIPSDVRSALTSGVYLIHLRSASTYKMMKLMID